VYTLLVPDSYDPFRPTPLVVGLHGGGRGGKDGKAVVGTGTSAMNFYDGGAQRLGWLVVCPSAIQAPWSNPVNDGFLQTVIDEVGMLFNVDRNRVYLTGHSMGGFGAWHFGPLYAHQWAAIAPMAGGGSPNLNRLEDTKTGVYLYHGANDEVVGVGNDHDIAVQMKKAGMDFVYAEIPDSGHGFPPEVEQEMWEFFKIRRRAVAADRGTKGPFTVSEEPESSFLDKPGKDEVAAFGPVGKPPAEESGTAELNGLIADLKAGGGLAQRAALALAAFKTEPAATRVAAVLVSADMAADSRRFAAEALGSMGHPSGVKSLQKALSDPDLSVVGAAAAALGKIPAPDTPKAYVRCVKDLNVRFEKKLTGRKMEFPDFDSHLDAVTLVVEGATALRDPASLPAVNLAASAFLLAPIDVERSERAGLDPLVPRRKLARALIAAWDVMKDASVKPVLTTLRERPELGVAEDVERLLSGL
jgi:hypothetical protein